MRNTVHAIDRLALKSDAHALAHNPITRYYAVAEARCLTHELRQQQLQENPTPSSRPNSANSLRPASRSTTMPGHSPGQQLPRRNSGYPPLHHRQVRKTATWAANAIPSCAIWTFTGFSLS